MTTPTISVVIPLYNKSREIERCLRSALNQTWADFEVVIVDDGSTDDSAAKVDAIQDARIRLIRQSNSGVAEARNHAIAEARADFICFLDADDEWLPSHLEQMLCLRKAVPQAGLFLTAFWVDRGKNVRRRIQVPGTFVCSSGEITDYFAMPDGKTLPSATGMLKSVLLKTGGYRQMFGEDVDMLLRAAAHTVAAYGHRATAVWHLDADNRRCVVEGESVDLYEPGSLLPSLHYVESSDAIAPAVSGKARDYVARLERASIQSSLLAGQRTHARVLLTWWEKEFQREDQKMARWIETPPALLSFYANLNSILRKAASAWGYLRDWLPNRRTLASLSGAQNGHSAN
jgi:glycosyltransferase involved in cell wall biosynthesis